MRSWPEGYEEFGKVVEDRIEWLRARRQTKNAGLLEELARCVHYLARMEQVANSSNQQNAIMLAALREYASGHQGTDVAIAAIQGTGNTVEPTKEMNWSSRKLPG